MVEQSIGNLIKRFRLARGLSQRQLARLSGKDRGYINQLEAGRGGSISLETAKALAKGLDIKPELFLQSDKPIPQESPEEMLDRFKIMMPATVPVYEELYFHADGPVSPIDYIAMARNRIGDRNLEGYMVHGNCLSPSIQDKDIIVIDRDGQVDVGDIVIVLSNGELHIGRLRKIAEEIYLEDNHGRIKLDDCQLAAPVVEVRRRLK